MSRGHNGRESTQQAFGRFFTDLSHEAEAVAKRVVTVSPDVASSTNLGGWINRAGIFSVGDRIDWFADDTDTFVRRREPSTDNMSSSGLPRPTWSGCSESSV